MADVFVSYARDDRDRVAPLVEAIVANGWSVWWDQEIGPGAAFRRVIEDELAAARCVVVVWTANSVESDWVNAEASEGLARRVLVPVRFEDIRIPLVFRQTQACDLFGWPRRRDDASLNRLLAAIAAGLGDPPPTRIEAPTTARFGRRALAAALLTVVTLLLAFLGPRLLETTPDAASTEPAPEPAASPAPAAPPPRLAIEAFVDADAAFTDEVVRLLSRTDALHVVPADFAAGFASDSEYRLRATARNGALAVSLLDTSSGRTRASFVVDYQRVGMQEAAWAVADRVLREFGRQLTVRPATLPTEDYSAFLGLLSELKFAESNAVRNALAASIEDIVERTPRFAEGYAALCRTHLANYSNTPEAEQFELAERRCARASRLDDADPWVRTALGSLYLTGGQLDRAAESFEAALALAPTMSQALVGLARTRAALGDPADARELLNRAKALEPANWSHYAVLGAILFETGDFAAAAQEFEQALPLSRDSADMLNDLGSAYFMLADYPRAIDAWERAVETMPTALALSNLGSARFFEGDFEGALDAYERALDLSDGDYRWWMNAGDAALQVPGVDARRYFVRAQELAQAAFEVNPEATEVLSALALARASSGQTAAALADLELLEARDDLGLYAVYDVAVAYRRLGEVAAATAQLDELVRLGYPRELLLKDANFQSEEIP